MRILVTGGSGFTGGHVIGRLVAGGHDVVALARSDRASQRVSELGADPIHGDLDDAASVDAAFSASAADALVNVASLGFGHAPAIIAAAEDAGIGRAVFVSTTGIFTALDPPSKAVRLAAEDAIRSSALAWTIIRPTMIYGAPGDRNMERLLWLLRRTPVVPLPDGGRRMQQPVHVEDLAGAIVAAVTAPSAIGRCYDVAGPEPLSFRDVVEQASRSVGRFPRLVSLPARPAVAALAAIERTGRGGPLKAEQIQRLLEDKAFDISDARRDLGYDPRPFVHGILDEAAAGRGDAGPVQKVGRYARTVAHIPPAQLAHRVRLRTARAALARWPEPFERRWRRASPACHWPAGFEALDRTIPVGCPSPEDNAKGIFDFLGDRRELGQPIDWRPADAPQLWRYNLHYWEWAWALADQPDEDWARRTFAELWDSWKEGTVFGRWDEWSPYVVAVRSWVLCNLFGPLVAGTDLEAPFLDDLGLHAGFVAANLELDVGGNHLIKDLKAAIGLGVFLRDEALVELGRRHLARQLDIQVLADGGHFELSPSYHAQVLGDLIDVERLLAAAGRPPIEGLSAAIASMRTWLGAMLLPDGDVPLFGDCTLVGPDRLAALGVTPAEPERLTVLQPSGYVIVRPGPRLHLVIDVGPPCPPQLPAHAQADCLSFVLCVDGERVITDPGTTTYEAGPQRAWERSTAAHNTIEIDGTDSTEVWSAFRAGRLHKAHLRGASDEAGIISVTASHDGYSSLAGRPVHERTWRAAATNVEIIDHVSGTGVHLVTGRMHLATGESERLDERVMRAGPVVVTTTGPLGLTTPADGAVDFLPTVETHCTAALPAEMKTTVSCVGTD